MLLWNCLVAGPGIEPRSEAYETSELPLLYPAMNGGGDKDRTCYILLAKQALSQMSYTPGNLFLAEHVGIEPTHPLLNDRLAICCLNRSANAP